MVSYLRILTFFLVFVAIFSSSKSISCYLCDNTPECAKQGGGSKISCSNTEALNVTGCLTLKYPDGSYTRQCSNTTAKNACANPSNRKFFKCKICTLDNCNIHTDF